MCRIKDCSRKTHGNGLCSMHYKRWRRTGEPEVKHVANFKGDDAGYLAIHVRLRKTKGLASAHKCECGARADEWSYTKQDPAQKWDIVSGVKVPYSTDLSHYMPRCFSCHRKVDAPLV